MRIKDIILLFGLILLGPALLIVPTELVAQTAEKPVAESSPAEKPAPVPELQDIVPLAANLSERLERLNGQLAKLETTEQLETDLAPSFEAITKFKEQLSELASAAEPDFGLLRGLKYVVQLEDNRIKNVLDQITGSIGTIEEAIDEWRREQQKWASWRKALSQDNLYRYVKPTFVSVEDMFRDAERIIEKHLKPFLAVQQKAWQAQNRLSDLQQRIDTMIVAIRGKALGTATPFLFSKGFLAQFDSSLVEDFAKGIRAIPLPEVQYVAQRIWVLLLQIFVIVALIAAFRRRPDLLKRSDRLEWFANRSAATGCFVGIVVLSDIFAATIHLRLALTFVLVLVTGRLLGGIIKEKWLQRSIYALLAIHLLVQIFDEINLPAPMMRLFVALAALAGLLAFGRHVIAWRKKARFQTWFLRLCLAVLTVTLAAEMFGFSRLAEYLFFSSVDTILALVMAWMLVRFLQGIIEVLVRSRRLEKFALIRNNAPKIIARTDLVCIVAIGLWVLVDLLRTWKIYADMDTALAHILALGLTVGDRHFSIGLMLAAGAVLYGAFLLSWSLQSLLLDGVILSRKMQQGVRISMARLIHYAIVLVGFLFTLSVLGFDFTNIAIIGGALGVGIGFGMQTIVNNFVCGLIMLFERPLKVGDSVEFGTHLGRVKHVGLRATVVETYDHAEIVVPNADLITGQVTNWTLAARRRRLKLPVGVAYGSDVSLVMQTLIEIAEDHVLVLSDPKPVVIFFGFGASSLDFELRVWIADFDSRRVVQSEINQDIDQRFRELAIEIPFPQQDLHLRSVDPSVSGPMATNVPD